MEGGPQVSAGKGDSPRPVNWSKWDETWARIQSNKQQPETVTEKEEQPKHEKPNTTNRRVSRSQGC